MGLSSDEVIHSQEEPKRKQGHPRRVRPLDREWPNYVVADCAALQYREIHADQLELEDGNRRSSYDPEAHACLLQKLWIKRGCYFGRAWNDDKIVVCRPPKRGRNVYFLVRPGEEKSGIIQVLTEKEARELARQSRRTRRR